jgi:hypothetical protein
MSTFENIVVDGMLLFTKRIAPLVFEINSEKYKTRTNSADRQHKKTS